MWLGIVRTSLKSKVSPIVLFEVALFLHSILSKPNRQEGHVGWIEWWKKKSIITEAVKPQ
jgi:hypothetical protein